MNFPFNGVICIIPTLNEEITIGEVVREAKRFAHRVVVVDGLSEDDTCKNALEAGAEVILQEGKGKGKAFNTVFNKIKGVSIYVTIDGDATYDPIEMGEIIKPIIQGEADMVIGSRLQGEMEEGAISRTNILGNKLFNFLINRLFGGNVTDSQSGYRAMTSKFVDGLNIDSECFEVETEITIKALKRGFRIKEVPITYRRRRGSPSKLRPFRAGSRIMITILKYLFKGEKKDTYEQIFSSIKKELDLVMDILQNQEKEMTEIKDRIDYIMNNIENEKA